MRINVAALKKAGVNVRIYGRNGKHVEHEVPMNGDIVIELSVEGGAPLSDQVTDEIRELIPSPAFAQATIDELYRQIHTLQVVCRINETEDK